MGRVFPFLDFLISSELVSLMYTLKRMTKLNEELVGKLRVSLLCLKITRLLDFLLAFLGRDCLGEPMQEFKVFCIFSTMRLTYGADCQLQ
jgi:hypothetical protein